MPARGGDGAAAPSVKVSDEDNLSAQLSTRGQVANPFVSHDFLCSLEQSRSVGARSGWQPRHLLAEDATGSLLGAAPCYVKSHSRGEYVFDHGWADAFERAGGDYYPKLQVAVPFTPVTGPRLLARPGPLRAGRARRPGRRARRDHRRRAPLVRPCHLPDRRRNGARSATPRLPAAHRPAVPLGQRGLCELRRFPRRASPRASARRSAASASEALAPGIEVRWLTGADLTEARLGRLLRFLHGHRLAQMGPALSHPRVLLASSASSMADRILLVMATRAGRWIARRPQLHRRRHALRPQLGRHRAPPVPAFRALLLSGDRLRDRARAQAGRGRRAGRAQARARLPAGHHLFRAFHRQCRVCGGRSPTIWRASAPMWKPPARRLRRSRRSARIWWSRNRQIVISSAHQA